MAQRPGEDWTIQSCPEHDDPPSSQTFRHCPVCKANRWTAEYCFVHDGIPTKKSRKDGCEACCELLCSTCNRAEVETVGARACKLCKRRRIGRHDKNRGKARQQRREDNWRYIKRRSAIARRGQTAQAIAVSPRVRQLRDLLAEVRESTLQEPQTQLAHAWEQLLSALPPDEGDWFATLHQAPDPLQDEGRAHVLETTEEGFGAIWDAGRGALDKYGCIVLRGSLRHPLAAAKAVMDTIRAAHQDDEAEVQDYSAGGGGAPVMEPWSQLLRRFDEGSRAPGRLPYNNLSMRAEIVASIGRPEALAVMESTVLSRATYACRAAKTREHSSNPSGKKGSEPHWLVDLESCQQFGLLAERRALSLWHMDLLNGTWVTCLRGTKLWFVYQGPWDGREDIQEDFARRGTAWTPQPGAAKMVWLEPGDSLIMRPGYPIIHAAATLDHCIMTGGMMWTAAAMPAILQNLLYIMDPRHTSATNESVPRQLPAVIDELIEGAAADRYADIPPTDPTLGLLKAFRAAMKERLSCACAGGCVRAQCACVGKGRDGAYRAEGCTAWCHPHTAPDYDPSLWCWRVHGAESKPCRCRTGCRQQCSCRAATPSRSCTAKCHPTIAKCCNGAE